MELSSIVDKANAHGTETVDAKANTGAEHNEITSNSRAQDDEEALDNEKSADVDGNLVYDNVEEEPELHLKTIVAISAMFLLNFVQIIALQGPPAVLNYIGADLKIPQTQTWIPDVLSLVQAILGPITASASDTFQARKTILVGSCVVSFVGCAIAPGSQSLARIVSAQVLNGFGFAVVPLAYAVPSEILPRKWRPAVQGLMNVAASLGGIAAPLTIGAMVEADRQNGWRWYFWLQLGLWGMTAIGIFFGYRPPKRHTRFDHLSLWQKIQALDLLGMFLLTLWLCLLITGLILGGGQFAWGSSQVLGTLIPGIVLFVVFCVYEWKGTTTGILHHDLFRSRLGKGLGRTFALCILFIFVEGILLFAYTIFYPVLTESLFTHDPFTQVLRGTPYWIASLIVTYIYGFWSTHWRSLRLPLAVGFTLFTAGIVGLATVEPHQSTNAIVFSALSGAGFGGPLVLIVAITQLCVPHHLIATGTAVLTSTRAVAASVFTAAYVAANSNKAAVLVPQMVIPAVEKAGLPDTSVKSFLTALSAGNQTLLSQVPGVSSAIIRAGEAAYTQALADSIRNVFIIAAPFGVVAIIACFFIADLRKVMNYGVDAPVERLQAKHHHD